MSNFPVDLAFQAARAEHYPQDFNLRERKMLESVKVYVDGHGGGTPATTKGDLVAYTTLPARLPVGTDGQVLEANSATPTGLQWVTPTSGGTVTSVALSAAGTPFAISGSPVTTAGTLVLSMATQAAGTVWAGPATGSAAAPTFRALMPSDLPGGGGSASTHVAWPAAAGSSFTAAHNLGTQLVMIQVVDAATFATIEIDSTARTTTNTATMTSSETPGASGWIVLCQAVS